MSKKNIFFFYSIELSLFLSQLLLSNSVDGLRKQTISVTNITTEAANVIKNITKIEVVITNQFNENKNDIIKFKNKITDEYKAMQQTIIEHGKSCNTTFDNKKKDLNNNLLSNVASLTSLEKDLAKIKKELQMQGASITDQILLNTIKKTTDQLDTVKEQLDKLKINTNSKIDDVKKILLPKLSVPTIS